MKEAVHSLTASNSGTRLLKQAVLLLEGSLSKAKAGRHMDIFEVMVGPHMCPVTLNLSILKVLKFYQPMYGLRGTHKPLYEVAKFGVHSIYSGFEGNCNMLPNLIAQVCWLLRPAPCWFGRNLYIKCFSPAAQQ